jgi:twinkle protein
MYLNWQKYNIDVPAHRMSGQYKTTCPNCRDSRHNPKDKSLSCNLATGEFHCHHCEWSGCVAEEEDWERQERKQAYFNARPIKRQKKEYRKPTPRPESPYSQKLLAYMTNVRHISEATMKALHITEGLEPMPQKGNKQCNTIQFNYYHNGELVNTKFRTGDKFFKLVTGAERLPYNVDSIKGEDYCIITEGEFDALSFIEAGYKAVVSVPTGANNNLEWLDDYIEEYFDDKKTIYIASDTDTKGVVLRDELLRRFGVERCKVVEYGDGCKDANEHLVKFGAQSLKECIASAKEMPVEGVFTVADFEASLDALYEKGLQKGATIGHHNFDEFCSFSTKRVCIVTGIPNHGKSEFLDEIIYRLNLRYGWKFAYFSPENEPLEFHASKLIEKFVGKRFGRSSMPLNEYSIAKQHLDTNFFFINPPDDFHADTIFDKARSLVRRNGIKGLVIDPYNYLEDDHGNSETDFVSKLLSKMKNFSKRNDIIIFLVAHPTKLAKNKDGKYEAPDLYNISGSAHFNNKADIGLSIHRIFGDDEYVEAHVLKMRFKHEGHKGVCFFKYNLANGRYVPYQPGTLNFNEWDNSNALIRSIQDAQQTAAANAVLPFNENFDNTDVDSPFPGNEEDCPY